ncbi:hypothetical protein L7F22_055814 [Adiantum nelumboides]|nr:hypothetical protein [Adiantum nelumboides]
MATDTNKPLLFRDIGKKAKDLLLKGFTKGHMLFFSHITSTGATLSTSSIMSEGLMIGTVGSSFKAGLVKSDLSFSTLNQVTAETTYEDLAPGLKLCLSTTIPDAKSLGKAELIYQHDLAAFTALVKGFNTTPTLECSANLGSAKFSAGGSLSYDSANNLLVNSTAGLGYTASPFSLALLCDLSAEKTVNVYCLHEMSTNTSWALNVDFQHEKKIGNMAIGGLHKLDPQTSVKAKIDNSGLLSALIEHELKPLVTIGLCAEFNCRSLNKERPNIGLSITVLSV